MTERRQWKTDGEIRAIVHEESDEFRDGLRRMEDRLEELHSISRDGAQASLNTAIILTGDMRFGVKGALPELRERLDKLEQSDRQKTEELATLKANTEVLMEGQGKIRRKINFLFKDKDGTWSYTKIVAAAGAVGAGVQQIGAHGMAWLSWLKKALWASGKY